MINIRMLDMKPYISDTLPLINIKWDDIVRLIAQANYEIALYAGLIRSMINPNVLLSPLATKEAVLSSKIEGTNTTLLEVLEFDASPDDRNSRYEDIMEVVNYRKAIAEALVLMEQRPLSLNLIRDVHAVLLDSVRGANSSPGNFRKEQNWIGPQGKSIDYAYFIPPEPNIMIEYLSNWEKYIHFNDKDLITQLAIIHAQFEIIHPFRDGNGRIGRILIPLFLFEKKLLPQPVFYMSEYFELNREEYYIRLRDISNNNNWQGWIEFFLNGVILQAKNNTYKAIEITKLYDNLKKEIPKLNSKYAIAALDTIFRMPIFNTASFVIASKIPKRTALRLIDNFVDKNIIRIFAESSGSKPSYCIFQKLISLTEHEFNVNI